MLDTSVEDPLDSLGTGLPVLFRHTLLLERALVDGNDDDAGEQKLGKKSTHPDSFGVETHVVVLDLGRIGDSIAQLEIVPQNLPELTHGWALDRSLVRTVLQLCFQLRCGHVWQSYRLYRLFRSSQQLFLLLKVLR